MDLVLLPVPPFQALLQDLSLHWCDGIVTILLQYLHFPDYILWDDYGIEHFKWFDETLSLYVKPDINTLDLLRDSTLCWFQVYSTQASRLTLKSFTKQLSTRLQGNIRHALSAYTFIDKEVSRLHTVLKSACFLNYLSEDRFFLWLGKRQKEEREALRIFTLFPPAWCATNSPVTTYETCKERAFTEASIYLETQVALWLYSMIPNMRPYIEPTDTLTQVILRVLWLRGEWSHIQQFHDIYPHDPVGLLRQLPIRTRHNTWL